MTVETNDQPDAPLRPHVAHPRLDPFAHPPRVLITPDVYKRMQLYLECSRAPLSFVGSVILTSNGNYLVDNVFVLPQEQPDGNELALNTAGLDDLIVELAQRGAGEADLVDRLNFWGITSPVRDQSKSDVNDDYLVSLEERGCPWAIKCVVSGNGVIQFDVYDFERGYCVADTPWAVHDPVRGVVLNAHGVNLDLLNDTGHGGEHRALRAFRELPSKLRPNGEMRLQVREEIASKVSAPPTERPLISLAGPLPHFPRTHGRLLTAAPKVVITLEAYQRMQLYVDLAPLEVGWMGVVKTTPRGHFIIENVFLITQEVSSMQTELSTEGINALTMELAELGDDGVDMMDRLRFWGHSHVRMRVSPSSTDEETMHRVFAAQNNIPFAIRGIFNKHGHGKLDLYRYDLGYRILDVPWVVFQPEVGVILQADADQTAALPEELIASAELKAQVAEEYAAKVIEPS